MVAREGTPVRRRGAVVFAGALALVSFVACSSAAGAPDRQPLPPRAVAAPKSETPPAEPPVATPPKPTTVVVLEPGEDAGEAPPATLAEAAARERERRRTAAPPVVVINDKNLASFAAGQKLTEAQPATDAEQEAAEAAVAAPTADGHDEAWWRQRGLEIRRKWHDAVDAVTRLEGEVADLRNRFYATDDPYVRDSQVKPEWDRKLAELDKARSDAAAGPDDVARFLEEGRRAGALPGWLREGVELEPQPVLPTVDGAEPVEPTVTEQEPPPR